MNCLFTSLQMQTAEKYTIETLGIPSLVLMERAALAVSEKVMTLYPKQDRSNVIVISGCGNNGADGIAVARILAGYGYDCSIFLFGNQDKMTAECRTQLRIARNMALPVRMTDADNDLGMEEMLTNLSIQNERSIIIDGLFGIGLNRPLKGSYIHIIDSLNRLSTGSGIPIVSIDLPSGLNASTGRVEGNAIKAKATITFEKMKTGHFLRSGPLYCGDLYVSGVGIDTGKIPENETIKYLENKDTFQLSRPATGNKGTFGKVLCITGSPNMGGAAILSARAALRSGAGMVKVVSLCTQLMDDSLQTKLLAEDPEIMYEGIPDNKEDYIAALDRNFEWCDILLLGCGLSVSPRAHEITEYVLQNFKGSLIIDADGLNLLANNKSLLLKRKEQGDLTILTPHPGEFHRLFSEESGYDKELQMHQDKEFITKVSEKYGIILVAKDAKTLITDGKEVYMNTVGNSGMATAGSGDVLAGMLAGFLAPVYIATSAQNAARVVYLHGLCGDYAAKKFGESFMVAGDIIRCLPQVMENMQNKQGAENKL